MEFYDFQNTAQWEGGIQMLNTHIHTNDQKWAYFSSHGSNATLVVLMSSILYVSFLSSCSPLGPLVPLECVCGTSDCTRCRWSCSLIRPCPTPSCSPIHCCSPTLHCGKKQKKYRPKERKKERKKEANKGRNKHLLVMSWFENQRMCFWINLWQIKGCYTRFMAAVPSDMKIPT